MSGKAGGALKREMGVTTIALHLFVDNHLARAMYQKLGHVGTDTAMAKEI